MRGIILLKKVFNNNEDDDIERTCNMKILDVI